jgi:putative ABC transport system permease protein
MLHLQKLTDIHLHSHLNSEWRSNGDIKNVYLFSVIAFFILLIACINFMNLATARSSKRAREIGMRKVLGARRKHLIWQFLGESVIISLISTVLAVILVEISFPYFNEFAGKELALNFIENFSYIFMLIGLLLFVGILAGSYPALYLSGFRPLSVIQDNSRLSSSRSVFRTVLVVAQFTISITLIICMAVVHNQVEFWINKDLGYDKEHIVLLPASPEIRSNLESVKTQLLKNPNISHVAGSRLVPTNNLVNSWGGRRLDGDEPEPLQFRLAVHECDYDFIDTYGMEILAGRNFSREYGTDDSAAFILNESAIGKLGWKDPEKAVGKPLRYGGQDGRVIGVVKNFHFESLHNKIVPIIFLINENGIRSISVKVRSENIRETIRFLEDKWQALRPEYPFEYRFLDDQYNNLYRSEVRLGEIFGVFAVLAVLIACLGLLGLVSFTAEQKTKEIGIRKVLGATVGGIVMLMTKEFSRWIIIANLVAWPIARYSMNAWLENFAYRIDISLWMFVLAGAVALLIALLTVGWQALRAAFINPVESLRYE